MKLFINSDNQRNKPGNMFYPNMNLLRYLLSLGILINHYNFVTGHNIPYFIYHDRIGTFFVLSGFLMYHSYYKIQKVGGFVKHRACRLLPTYIFIVLFCAFGGVLITTLSSTEYFNSESFWKYLGCNLFFLNWLQPNLPGVFEGHEFVTNTVNSSLWTMKVEILLDLSVPLFLFITTHTKLRKELLALIIIVSSMFLRMFFISRLEATGNGLYEILSRQFFGQASFFYFGMLAYFYRHIIKKYKFYFIALGFILYIVGPCINYGDVFISPISVTFLAIGISVIGTTIKPFIHTNCISYNIFLIHFPIIQVALLIGLNNYPVWISLGTILLITVLLAILTNRFIDKPFSNLLLKNSGNLLKKIGKRLKY